MFWQPGFCCKTPMYSGSSFASSEQSHRAFWAIASQVYPQSLPDKTGLSTFRLCIFVVVVQSLSHVLLFVTLSTAAPEASLSFTISWNLLKFMSIELLMPSNHLILCCPLLLLPSILPRIRVFSNELALCIRWPKYWSFSFSINPSNEYSGLISFRIDGLISLLSKGLSRVFFNTTVQKHQFFRTQLSLWSSSHNHTWLLEKSQLWLDRPLLAKLCLCFLICCLGLS